MNKTALKLFAIGFALTFNGIVYLTFPDFLYNNIEFKQILIALLSVIIALMVVNVWLNVRKKKE